MVVLHCIGVGWGGEGNNLDHTWQKKWLNPLTPGVSYGDIKVILTSESVDEIPWCDYSNETLSEVLSHGTIYI